MLEPSIQYCNDIIIAILQNTNLLNDNFSFCTSLTRLYVVRRYVVVNEEMINQPNVLYIGIIFQRFVSCTQIKWIFITICCTAAPVYVYTHTHTHDHAWMHAHMYTHIYIYIHLHVDIHAHGETPHTCEHAHTHTWGHTHTHTRIG